MSKIEIYEFLVQLLNERISELKFAKDAVQESTNNESKSSAGDKYETGRAMGQIEVDLYANQLQKAKNELDILKSIDLKKKNSFANTGSLLETSAGYFFISISIGNILVNNKKVIVCSINSPIGQILKGKKVGDTFEFMKKQEEIFALA